LGWLWLIPGLQVAIEQTWPALFPYYHGALFYRSDITWQFASIFGVTGLTYLIFLTNVIGVEFFYSKRSESNKPPVSLFNKHHALAGGLILFHLAFGWWRRDAVEEALSKAPTLRVAILQQDVTMTHRLSRSPWIAIRDWGRQTVSILDQKPDLVVWPEGALGGPINPDDTRPAKPLGGKSLKEFFGGLAKDHEFAFLIGGGTINFHDELDDDGFQTYTAYNSCYLFDQTGEITGRYDKMIPLPFGEYIPFAETFPILRKWIQGPGNFRAGTEVTYFQAHNPEFEYTFSTPICYEAILNYQMHKMANADLFINITNDAWFGKTAAPHQHAMLTTVQAIEWGRPLFRLAYTGVSFVVEPHGKILYETKPFEEVSTVETIRMGTINTIYRQGGWIFPWVWVVGWSLQFILIIRGRKKTL
jgi:apolipoprotein N-acyltransferase